jgi:hypothetical protein
MSLPGASSLELPARCSGTRKRVREQYYLHPLPQKFTGLGREHNPKAGVEQGFSFVFPAPLPPDTGAVLLPLFLSTGPAPSRDCEDFLEWLEGVA